MCKCHARNAGISQQLIVTDSLCIAYFCNMIHMLCHHITVLLQFWPAPQKNHQNVHLRWPNFAWCIYYTCTTRMHLSRDQKIIINAWNRSKCVRSSAPPDGVHCGGSESTRKAHYLHTHFDRFQALIIIVWSCDKCICVVQV